MNATNFPRFRPSGVSRSAVSSLICTLVIGILMIPTNARPQTAPITPSGLHTEVNLSATPPAGHVQYDITGGTRPGGASGTNLFHSFGDFSIPTNNIANFLNARSVDLNGHVLASNLPTSNILGRVTGGDPSVIFGMIETNGPNGFGGANLFLMNPSGFLFGPNATVNVGGMMTFTTADYLRFQGTNTLFNKVSTPESLSLLSTVPVTAFGFLGSNPAAIAIQGSTLRVAQGQTLSFVGGNTGFKYIDPDTGIRSSTSVPGGVTMTGGKLQAFGGQINLASIASPGKVSAVDFIPASGMTMGTVSLSQGALLDVSADASGTVRIRGGQFVIDNATVSANTAEINGAPVAIDVAVSGDLVITSNNAPAFTARTTGAGDAGDIHLDSGGLTATSLPNNSSFSFIESYTAGSGNAGNIRLTTKGLNVSTDPSSVPIFFIDSGTGGEGNGGNIAIYAKGDAHFSNTGINTGDVFLGGSGSAGNISIRSHALTIAASTFTADSVSARGGDMTLAAREIALSNNSFLDVLSLEGKSTIHITADRLTVDDASSIINQTALGTGGGITITSKSVEVTNSSLILSQTFGDGDAGNIHVTATDHVTVTDDPQRGSNPSGFYTNSLGNAGLGTHGNAGAIEITTPRLILSGGARINSTTQSSGQGGDVTITAHDVTLSGQRTLEVFAEAFGFGETKATGIYTRTVGSEFCAGSCGDAGHVTIDTGSLAVNGGAVIDSGTTNNGQGGTISVNATDQISISGTLNDGMPGGIFSRTIGTSSDSGAGGNIALSAGQSVKISNGASVSASSTGPGDTGNIQIDAGNQFAMANSSVTTEATQAGGGAIKIMTDPNGTVQLTNSTISASVLNGMGGGGSVDIDPLYVLLQNSQILAQAVNGPGGNITITITNGGLFLPDANSTISASSQFGVNGTVTIQSPNSPISGQIQPIGATPLQGTSLFNQHCAALADGQFSSFTVGARDSLPTEPDNWLASSPVLGSTGFSAGAVAEGGAQTHVIDPAHESTVLSLRQIAPAGFLTHAFAVEGSTTCHS